MTEEEVLKYFDQFWSLYPRKVAKPYALRCFKAALRRGNNGSDILLGLRAYLARWSDRGTDRTFIPHPSTWLNGERWTDGDIHLERLEPEPDQGNSSQPNETGKFIWLNGYLSGCTIEDDKIIVPTEARKAMILNRFQHKHPDLQIVVRK